MRVRIPGSALKEIRVLEHVLQFAADGWAEAEHLTAAEIARCRKFGFVVEKSAQKREKPKSLARVAAVQSEEASNDVQKTVPLDTVGGEAPSEPVDEAAAAPTEPPIVTVTTASSAPIQDKRPIRHSSARGAISSRKKGG